MRQFTFLLGLIILTLLTLSERALSQNTIFQAPNGFWIIGKRPNIMPYGATFSGANWHIAQWQNPSAGLSAFAPIPCKEGSCYTSIAPAAQVDVRIDKGEFYYYLRQDGQQNPCGSGYPVEFNLFAGANNEQHPTLSSAILARPVLGRQTSFMHRIRVHVSDVYIGPRCEANRAIAMTALVLRNHSIHPPQVLFYQLRLFKAGIDPAPFWWWRGEALALADGSIGALRFGFGDNLSSFGLADVREGMDEQVQVDLAPRLRQVIMTGPAALNKNLSHWQVTATYHGQAIWGEARLSSRWSEFSMAETRSTLKD